MDIQSVYKPGQLDRDIRHPLTKFSQYLKTDQAMTLIGGVYASSYVFPQYSVAIYFVTGCLVLASRKRFTLPVHLPIFARQKLDWHNLKTRSVKGKNVPKAQPPAGLVYVGNMQSTNEQIWWDKPLCCTHLFFLATTGGGKTFSFAGILSNFVIYSGFCYSDAKADLALIETYSRLMWRMGRINQLYILSFQSGNRNPWDVGKAERISHSFNPAANGSAPMIAELFKALLDGDGDIWAKRGDNLSTVLIRPLTYMRDKYKWPMGFGQIASFFTLEKLGELCGIGEGRVEAYPIPVDHKKYFTPLVDFMRNLPGIDENGYLGLATKNKELISKIHQTVRDQLGYVTMQLVNVTNDLVGDYGHIFETMYGQINLEDALTNRKVVITLLPALERSESTMSVLGRITLAAQKTIVANAQAFKLGGSLSEHLGSRPTMADTPYASVNDEAGSYMVDGVSANTAMARSANVFFAFGGQDLQAMKKRGGMIEKEVDTIWGTTVNKMAGSVLEQSTIDAFIQQADKQYKLEMAQVELEHNSLYTQQRSNTLQVVERSVLTAPMLANQEAGQVQLMTRGTVRAISLPNYITGSLTKKVVNFYVTETIPVIPLPHEEVFLQKEVLKRLRNAIRATKEHGHERGFENVFEEELDKMPDGRNRFAGITRAMKFFNDVMDQFEQESYKRINLFTAGALSVFYFAEFCRSSLRHVRLDWAVVNLDSLEPTHRRALGVLFGPRASVLDEIADTPRSLADSLVEYDEIEDEDEFAEQAQAIATDPGNIAAFQEHIAAIMDEEFQAQQSELAPAGNSDLGLAARVLESSTDTVDLFNFSNTPNALRDISGLLQEDGLSTTAPTLLPTRTGSTQEPVNEPMVDSIDAELATLTATRNYKPVEYRTSKEQVIETINDLLASLERSSEEE